MRTKILEVRDAGTFLPVVAVQMFPEDGFGNEKYSRQRYLLRRVGYPCGDRYEAQVVLFRANGDGEALSDPYQWPSRMMQVAHIHILEKFADLRDGDVVDVEFLLGLRPAPKVSEREASPLEG